MYKHLTLLITLFCSSAAYADVMTLESLGSGQSVEYKFDGDDGETWAGILLWDNGLQTFCGELEQPISVGNTVNFTASPVSNSYVIEYFNDYLDLVTDDQTAAAFQVGLWELLYDSHRNLNGGNFKMDEPNSVKTLAQSWLNGLTGDTIVNPTYQVSLLQSGSKQDQVLWVASVPEPSTVLMTTLMLIGAAFYAVWKN